MPCSLGGCFMGWMRCLLICLLAASPALAQTTTGNLIGTVHDAAGSVVSGAAVKAEDTDTNLARTTVSSESGTYCLASLPPGTYRIEAGGNRFKKEIQTDVRLQVNQTLRIDFTLQVGPAVE